MKLYTKRTDYNIYPNPNHGHFIFEWNVPKAADGIIKIINPQGKIVFYQPLHLVKGINKIEFESELSKGIYFLNANSTYSEINESILIHHH